MLADNDRTLAERDRKRQEIRVEPWKMMIAGMTAGAALMAAGAALFAALLKLAG